MSQRANAYSDNLQCLRLAPEGELVEWALRIHLPLTGWIDNKVVLLGDAAHATLPHIAQGAAQAGEDGAVLGTLLAKCQTKEDIPQALKAYERLRKTRADWAVEQARLTGAYTLSAFRRTADSLSRILSVLPLPQVRHSTCRTGPLRRRVTRH